MNHEPLNNSSLILVSKSITGVVHIMVLIFKIFSKIIVRYGLAALHLFFFFENVVVKGGKPTTLFPSRHHED
jgi:hypothetical protein